MLKIGTDQATAMEAATKAVVAILAAVATNQTSDVVAVKALELVRDIARVDTVSISNCTFYGE
jgi:hypothetical protein